MATTTKVSPEEYLRLERKAEFGSEYIDGAVLSKPGATREQALIDVNIIGELCLQVKNSDCEIYASKMKVRFPASYRYPDVTIVRGTPNLRT
jgi:Uma2 family endonuclease